MLRVFTRTRSRSSEYYPGSPGLVALVTGAPGDVQQIHIVTCPPGGGITLPADLMPRRVINAGANVASVYPPSGGQWFALGANNPGGVAIGGSAEFQMSTPTQGYVW